MYVPNHLHHILFELIKNAMRATVDEKRKHKLSVLSPLHILVFRSESDLTVRVRDLGGGVPYHQVDKLFRYHSSSGQGRSVMHGLGYGLPLSRLYARYLAGEVSMVSMCGQGTDLYLHLRSLSDQTVEILPTTNRLKNSNMRTKVKDW